MSSDTVLHVKALGRLALVCSVGFWAGPLSATAAGRAPAGTEGGLEIVTEPAGAQVYVNAESKGTTPIQLHLMPGDHRVTLVKEGYLENSRVVSVESGRSASVEVKLTSSVGEPRHAAQITPGGGGGGGESFFAKHKWLIIGGAGGGGAAAYFLLRDTNKPPTAALTISPTGTGVAGFTTFTLNASASSDPDGDPLTYAWTFGDGGTGTGVTTTHVYSSAGTSTVTVTVSDAKETATASGSVTVGRNLSGTFSGRLANTVNTTNTFTQSGGTVSGTTNIQNVGNGTLDQGSFASSTGLCPCTVAFRVTVPGFIPFTFTGTANSDLSQLNGVVNGSGFNNDPWTMSR